VPRRFFRKYLPDAETVRSHRLMRALGWLHHPNLWHLNRRSVSRAVGIGLFAGLIPGPLQMLGAILLAVPLRANVLVAMATTLYTNPLTIVPLYLLAFAYGKLILQAEHVAVNIQPLDTDWFNFSLSMRELLDWCLAMGKPLALGLVALALTLGIVGAVATRLAWRWYVIAAWQRRRRRRSTPRG
jgi:uncharacterized protein